MKTTNYTHSFIICKRISFITLLFLLLGLTQEIKGQVAQSLTITDTRSINDQPKFNTSSLRLDLKTLSTIGLAKVGTGYSANLTISPWTNSSGILVHQLNFNNYGIFCRTGKFDSPTWDNWKKLMTVNLDGSLPGNLLVKGNFDVNGIVRAKEMKVENTNWPDYVFSKDYILPSLEEVSQFIQEHKHLPEVPSAFDVENNGINIGQMNAKLLQKIEELTLYTIQQQKVIDKLIEKVEVLEKQNRP